MSQFCTICRGYRNVVVIKGKPACAGCGTPVRNCQITDAQLESRKQKPLCPSCKSKKVHVLEEGRFECDNCYAVFENVEQWFIDDRPEHNAMKKERTR